MLRKYPEQKKLDKNQDVKFTSLNILLYLIDFVPIKERARIARTSRVFNQAAKKSQILFAEIKQGSILGSGAFGRVFQGQYRSEDVAIKVYHDQVHFDEMISEAENMVRMKDSSNIVRLIGYSFTPLCLVMEHMSKNSLRHVSDSEKLPWNIYLQMAIDLCSALVYIHERGYVHGDIKLENIFVNQKYQAKVGDLGIMSKQKGSKNSYFGGQLSDLAWLGEALMEIVLKTENYPAFMQAVNNLINKKIPSAIDALKAFQSLSLFATPTDPQLSGNSRRSLANNHGRTPTPS